MVMSTENAITAKAMAKLLFQLNTQRNDKIEKIWKKF